MENETLRKYMPLLIAIQQDPFSITDDLAAAAGISKPTLIKRLRFLQGRDEKTGDFLEESRKYFVVKPILNYASLGLEEVDVLVESNSLKDIEELENIATRHPYTAYRGRCFGFINGLLLQFRVPMGTTKNIQSLLKKLHDEGTICSYEILPTKNAITKYTSMRLEGWNNKKMSWEFDWTKWFSQDWSKKRIEPQQIESQKALNWLTKNDVYLISELMRGSRRLNTEMIRSLETRGVEFTPQTFGRHYQLIKDECIRDFRVTFDPEAFDILNSILVIGKGSEAKLLGMMAAAKEVTLPFESTIRVIDEHLFWFIRLSQEHISPFLNGLLAELESMRVCYLDYSNSLLYYLWPEAFDEESRSWFGDHEFMVEKPLKER